MGRINFRSAVTARNILILVWIGFFFINLASILYLYLDNWIEQDNFKAAMNQLNTSYVPFIGAILAFYLGDAHIHSESKSIKRNSGMPFFLALFLSIVWNSVIFLFILPPVWGIGVIENTIENIREIGSMLSWLVFPAIGYYFGNYNKKEKD